MSAAADNSRAPQHLGIILDGNRRWAVQHGLNKFEGHRKGYENLKTIARLAFDRGVTHLSAYVFSTENWDREKAEVSYLMDLAYKVFTQDLRELHKEGVRIRFIGSKDRVSKKILKAIAETEVLTAQNTKANLNLCFNYGGHDEIAYAARQIAREGVSPDDITPQLIKSHLYTAELPPADIIVRTSGEQRLSNFLLWDSAYAELIFVPEMWPEFNEASLDGVLSEYAQRQRRFGK